MDKEIRDNHSQPVRDEPRVVYGLSIPDIEPEVNGEVCGEGCGSTEYFYNTRAMRDRDAKKIAKQLRQIAKDLEKGIYNCDLD